ncbi:hypothetical protein [Chitinophaga nivalis]|uniref:Uncharacterized protein n=1 Tax=Chitinophaga nivalis TaxID=2991709 RepID=A0ABT3IJ37_9BACT|nr:hypothetical protein [Chitinophaga nivalis]MCW3466332.1 hypothetical protein [Chitinophaga nivalis]MCW3483977.1 hypothetical protein [Chitinophaga nivalis]
MRRTKIYVNSTLALLVTLLTISSCKKENANDGPVAPEKPAAEQAVEDHLTITPERQKVIDFFNNNKNARGQATGAVAAATYRSFTINYAASVPNDIKTLVNGEIDQLYNTSITATTKSRMTGAPINVYSSPGSGDLFYVNGNVYIVNFNVYRQVHTGAGNVIFHELFHYLHDRWVSGGFNNSTIINYYRNIRTAGVYPAGSYVLSNQGEYFAVSAEANYCSTSRPPYNASTFSSSDPNLKSYLTTNF